MCRGPFRTHNTPCRQLTSLDDSTTEVIVSNNVWRCPSIATTIYLLDQLNHNSRNHLGLCKGAVSSTAFSKLGHMNGLCHNTPAANCSLIKNSFGQVWQHYHHFTNCCWKQEAKVNSDWSNEVWKWGAGGVANFFATFKCVLLLKYLELRNTPHMLHHVLNYAEHDGDLTFTWKRHEHDLTVGSKSVKKSAICRGLWYVFYVIFMSRERRENSWKIDAPPLGTWKWSCYDRS